jgi:hypothetical protein
VNLLIATATAAPSGELMEWARIIAGAGIAGVMLWYVVAKVIPRILDKHSAEMEKEEERHARQEDQQRTDFLGALDGIEARCAARDAEFMTQLREERQAREAQLRETTEMGHQQASAMIRLTDSIDGLRKDLNTNTDVLRGLNAQGRRMATGRHRAADVVAAVSAARNVEEGGR